MPYHLTECKQLLAKVPFSSLGMPRSRQAKSRLNFLKRLISRKPFSQKCDGLLVGAL